MASDGLVRRGHFQPNGLTLDFFAKRLATDFNTAFKSHRERDGGRRIRIEHQVRNHLMGTIDLIDDSLQRCRSRRVVFAPLQLLCPRGDVGKRIVDFVTQAIRQLLHGPQFAFANLIVKRFFQRSLPLHHAGELLEHAVGRRLDGVSRAVARRSDRRPLFPPGLRGTRTGDFQPQRRIFEPSLDGQGPKMVSESVPPLLRPRV